MAFEMLDEYTDVLVNRCKHYQAVQDDITGKYDPRTRSVASLQEMLILDMLGSYHDTVLSRSQWRSQRMYCRKKIEEISPAFAEGYFKRRPKLKL